MTMHQPMLDVALVPKTSEAEDGTLEMFERLARDPNASVEKIAGLMALWERAQAKKAEMAYNAAMTAAQQAMRPVAMDAHNPQTQSRYASYKALDLALRPIYTTHGFGLSFDTADAGKPDHVRVVCKVTHAGGHAEVKHLDMPADGKGAKGGDVMTKTHATGSAISYGMRYLLKMVFNISVGEADDDGNRAGAVAGDAPIAPDGYEKFVEALTTAAAKGTKALFPLWNKSPEHLRQYMTKHGRTQWEALKATAAGVK